MNKSKYRLLFAAIMTLCMCWISLMSGCNSNSNEAEYLRTTTPGERAEPESVASRRERTKVVPQIPAKGARGKQKAGRE
jgi:hypothetical protein